LQRFDVAVELIVVSFCEE